MRGIAIGHLAERLRAGERARERGDSMRARCSLTWAATSASQRQFGSRVRDEAPPVPFAAKHRGDEVIEVCAKASHSGVRAFNPL